VVVPALNRISALGASRQLAPTDSGLQLTIEHLTAAHRLSGAPGEGAGLSLIHKLGAEIRIAGQGKRNAKDAASFLQAADRALDRVTDLLTRAAELGLQAQTSTLSDTYRANLNAEFQSILTTLADLGSSTRFNGSKIFTSGDVVVPVGPFTNITFQVGALSGPHAGAADILTFTQGTDKLDTAANALAAAGKITAALNVVGTLRANLGASQQQSRTVSNALAIQAENCTAAYSQVQDADLAGKVVNLTKFQILNQSETSPLSQSQRQILELLR
jgi:flagellin